MLCPPHSPMVSGDKQYLPCCRMKFLSAASSQGLPLGKLQKQSACPSTQEESTSGKGRGDEQPSWSQSFLSEGHGDSQSGPQLLRKSQEEAAKALDMDFAEPELQMFDYISQVLQQRLHPLHLEIIT